MGKKEKKNKDMTNENAVNIEAVTDNQPKLSLDMDSIFQMANNLLKDELVKGLNKNLFQIASSNPTLEPKEQKQSNEVVSEEKEIVTNDVPKLQEEVQIEEQNPETTLRSKLANHFAAIEADLVNYISNFEAEIRAELAEVREQNSSLVKQVSQFQKENKEKEKDKEKKKKKKEK